MEVQKINNQASFGIRKIRVENNVDGIFYLPIQEALKDIDTLVEITPEFAYILANPKTDILFRDSFTPGQLFPPPRGPSKLQVFIETPAEIIKKTLLGKFKPKEAIVSGEAETIKLKRGNMPLEKSDILSLILDALKNTDAVIKQKKVQSELKMWEK